MYSHLSYLERSPSFLANRPMQSSDSPIIRMDPQMAYTLDVPVMLPVLGSTSTRLSCTEAWSLAWMMRLLAELEDNKKIRFEVRLTWDTGSTQNTIWQMQTRGGETYHLRGRYKSTSCPASFSIFKVCERVQVAY